MKVWERYRYRFAFKGFQAQPSTHSYKTSAEVSLMGRLLSLAHRFLGTLKQHTLQGAVHGEDDLNVEHFQLMLLLFHNLSERGRGKVLTLVTQAIADVALSRESQLKAVPLNLARLLLVFDYLLRHYSKAPLYLFEQVDIVAISECLVY